MSWQLSSDFIVETHRDRQPYPSELKAIVSHKAQRYVSVALLQRASGTALRFSVADLNQPTHDDQLPSNDLTAITPLWCNVVRRLYAIEKRGYPHVETYPAVYEFPWETHFLLWEK